MFTIRETDEFADWLASLPDAQVRARIARGVFIGSQTEIPET